MCLLKFTIFVTLISLKVASCSSIFLYPEDKSSPFTMPESCKGKTFCFEKGDDYPDEEDTYELLESTNWYSDRISEQEDFFIEDGGQSDSECEGTHALGPIYYIVDEQNMTRAVVHAEDLFEQRYELRWCNNEGRRNSTRNIFQNHAEALNLKLSCDTSYLTYEFYVFGTGQTLTMDLARAKIPVCCKCRYERSY